MLLGTEQQGIDAVVNSVLGWIAAKWADEHSTTLSTAYARLFSTQLYEDLLDYTNTLYMTDPLELFHMFEDEIGRG